MSVFVCVSALVFVCVSALVFVCVSALVFVCVSALVFVCVSVCTLVCASGSVGVRVHTCVWFIHLSVFLCICQHFFVHLPVLFYVFVHLSVFIYALGLLVYDQSVYVHAFICLYLSCVSVCKFVCEYIYICLCISLLMHISESIHVLPPYTSSASVLLPVFVFHCLCMYVFVYASI